MSILQEQAVQMIRDLSDDKVSLLIEIIKKIIPRRENPQTVTVQDISASESRQAFQRLNDARSEIHRYLPEDFDPDRELEEARAER